MSASTHLSGLSTTPLTAEGLSVNYSAILSALTLLGWQDKRPAITQAEETDRVLADNLQTAYTQYLALSDQSSANQLNASLTAIMGKLEKDRATAMRLAKEASDRLTQETADDSHTGMTSFIGGLATRFKTLIGSDDAVTAEHYKQLAAKYTAQLEELSHLCATLQWLLPVETAEITVHSSHQRGLLQTTNLSLPVTGVNQFCDPAGTCYLSAVSNGYSGFMLQGEAASDFSGASVSSAGDINGDGLSDLLIGAPYATASGNYRAGKTYLVFGSQNISIWGSGVLNVSALMDGHRGFILEGEVASDVSGASVSSAGDINGDGLSDLLIGAPYASPPGNYQAGKIYLVFGSRNTTAWGAGVLNLGSLMNGQHGFVLQGEEANDQSGHSVSSAGDINGDGLSDLLIGAYEASPPGQIQAGKSYLVFGSRNTNAWGTGVLSLGSLMDGQRGFVLQGEVQLDYSGASVSSAGDINGDGLSDLLIGAPGISGSGNAGKTYLIFGSRNTSVWGAGVLNLSSLRDGQRGFVLRGEAVDDASGCSVSSAGDINGDGLSDLLIGADQAVPLGKSQAGKSYVVFGSSTNTVWSAGVGLLNLGSLMDGQRGFVLQGETAGDFSGSSVSSAGDINGDGLSDLLIGAYGATKSYVVFGSSTNTVWGTGVLNLGGLMDGQRGFVLQGETAGDFSGSSVSSAGDINGDGLSDLLIGAYLATSSGKAQAGKSYVVFGPSSSKLLYFTANYLRVGVGEKVQLTSQALNVASNQIIINENATHFTIQNLKGGIFTLVTAPTISITVFYMQNVSDGLIQFIQDGSPAAPQYRVVADLPVPLNVLVSFAYSDAKIDFVGYIPILVNNRLAVSQGTPIALKISDLSANDQSHTPSQLFFIMNNIMHGQFSLYDSLNALIAANITQFSEQAILDGRIEFIHDGSRNVPSYAVAVTNGNSITNPQAAAITFNYAPELNITASALILDQGQATTLSPRDIIATDVETFGDPLIIYTANVSDGYFVYASNLNRSITAFQQLSLTTDTVEFVQDGSGSIPGFALRAFDGILYSPWQSPLIQLNHRPVLQGVVSAQTVTQGDDFSFALPQDLFSDPDVNDTLTYRAQLKGIGTTTRSPLPPEIQFTPPRQFSGNLLSVNSFNIEVEASDPRGLKASTSFILSSQESKAAYYRSVYGSLSGIAGTGVALLAYLWLRRRIAKHRRDFPFANDLRKVLNLEYYDFTRFDGDAFKTKVNDFLQRLQSEHQEFYTQLTPEEQNSFAVCVAEILTKRGLVSRSGYGGGLFGILCFLNVGWPTELNLKAFEVQSWDIAAEAVTTWKNAAVAEKDYHKPLKRWPYYSPSKKEKLKVFCCCAKPSSADRWLVSDSHFTQSIALTELKKREGTDSALTIEPVAERKTSHELASQVVSLEEQVRIIREENKTMAVTIKLHSEKIEAFESQPLLQQGK